MSDVSGGPGWWMASDGKWYPPESHPSYRPPAPPPPPPPPYPSPGPHGGAAPYQYPYPAAVATPPLATYGQRLGGWLLDWVILIAVSVPLSLATHSFHYTHVHTFNSTSVSFHLGMPGALLSPLIVLAYGTLTCGSTRGQTLGMMVAGTRAVKQATGSPIGYGAALGRAAFEELMAILLFGPPN